MTSSLFPVCKTSEVPDDGGKEAYVKDRVIAVFNIDGNFYAIDDTCTHMKASLSEGYVEAGEVECPLHAGRFDVRTGEPTASPCTQPVRTYPVQVIEDQIHIEIPDQEEKVNSLDEYSYD